MAAALSPELLKRFRSSLQSREVDQSGTTQVFGGIVEGGYRYDPLNGGGIAVYKDYGPNGRAPVGDALLYYKDDGSFSHEGAIRDVKFGADLVKFGLAAGAMAFGIPAVMGTGGAAGGAAAAAGAEAAGAAAGTVSGTVSTGLGSSLPAAGAAGAGVSSASAAGGAGLGIGGASLGAGELMQGVSAVNSLKQGMDAKSAAKDAASQAAEQQARAEAAARAAREEAAANATKAEAERKAAADKAMKNAALTSAFLKKARSKNTLFTGGGSLLGNSTASGRATLGM